MKSTCAGNYRSCRAALELLDRSGTQAIQSVRTDAYTHSARRCDRHERASNIAYYTYAYISMWGAKARRNMTFKPSLVTPYLRLTELMEPYRHQPWIISIPKYSTVRIRKSGVHLCCRAFFLSTQQYHVSHRKHMCKNGTTTSRSDVMIKP